MFAWERGTPDLKIGKRTLREWAVELNLRWSSCHAATIESQSARAERERSSRESLEALRGNTQRCEHPPRKRPVCMAGTDRALCCGI